MRAVNPKECEYIQRFAKKCDDRGTRVLPLFSENGIDPAPDAPGLVFDDQGFWISDASGQPVTPCLPWEALYGFTNTFWAVRRFLLFEASLKRGKKKAVPKRPKLRLVTKVVAAEEEAKLEAHFAALEVQRARLSEEEAAREAAHCLATCGECGRCRQELRAQRNADRKAEANRKHEQRLAKRAQLQNK